MLLLLLLIPVLTVTFSLFISTLVNYIILNDFNVITFIITIFITIVLSFIILKCLVKENKQSLFWLNFNNSLATIHGYISFVMLFFLGLALVMNSFVNKLNIYNIIIGILIIVAFAIITYKFLIQNKEQELTLTSIESLDDKIKLLYFTDSKDIYPYYVSENEKFSEEHVYICKVNLSSKTLKKVLKEKL